MAWWLLLWSPVVWQGWSFTQRSDLWCLRICSKSSRLAAVLSSGLINHSRYSTCPPYKPRCRRFEVELLFVLTLLICLLWRILRYQLNCTFNSIMSNSKRVVFAGRARTMRHMATTVSRCACTMRLWEMPVVVVLTVSLHEHDGVERGFAPRWSCVLSEQCCMHVSFSGLGGSFVVPYPVYRAAGDGWNHR